MQLQTKFSIWYTLGILGLVLLIDSVLFSGPAVPQIPYSEFLERVQRGAVERVVIAQDRIYGVMRDPAAPPKPAAEEPLEPPAKETPWRLPLDRGWRWL